MTLPNGKQASDVEEYVKTWRRLGTSLCDALEWEYTSYAFDPNLTIRDKKGQLHDIPVKMAERIIELYRKSLVD